MLLLSSRKFNKDIKESMMKEPKLSIFEHQHPYFKEDPADRKARLKQERRVSAMVRTSLKNTGEETMEQFMDRIGDRVGLNSRSADKVAEAASEAAFAQWDKPTPEEIKAYGAPVIKAELAGSVLIELPAPDTQPVAQSQEPKIPEAV